MASTITPLVAQSPDTQSSQSSKSSPAADALASRDVFLQLLVNQIKNQDPLNPMDSMAFVTQLAQFSQLEAILGMRSDLRSLVDMAARPAPEPAAAAQ